MQEQINQLQQEMAILQGKINLLYSSATIPYDVENAFIDRLDLDNIVSQNSSKLASTETQAVNEGGSATYNVAKPMDGFEQRTVNGQIRYYPYYT
jgi:hypothetical protein